MFPPTFSLPCRSGCLVWPGGGLIGDACNFCYPRPALNDTGLVFIQTSLPIAVGCNCHLCLVCVSSRILAKHRVLRSCYLHSHRKKTPSVILTIWWSQWSCFPLPPCWKADWHLAVVYCAAETHTDLFVQRPIEIFLSPMDSACLLERIGLIGCKEMSEIP